jgi:putative lipoic acid-binding regulatory protein
MTDTEVKAPKIEFPANDYPVKVISDTGVGNKDKIIDIVRKHATINEERVDERQSSNGKYTTIQLHIVATGQEQLYDINSELRATGFVHMVL